MRRAAKVDAIQNEVVDGLRELGCTVVFIGFPVDLLVGYGTRNYLLELKDGNKPPSRRRLTEKQRRFRLEWRGQLAVVKSLDEARAVVGV